MAVTTRASTTQNQTATALEQPVNAQNATNLEAQVQSLTNCFNTMMANFTVMSTEMLRMRSGEGSSRYSRMGKMEFPKFYGDDVKGWLYRIKQFFIIDGVSDEDKVKLVSIHMYDRALAWHLQFIKTYGEAVAWQVYEEAVLKRFGEVNEDPLAELKNLRYKTTMKQYQSDFETLLTQVTLTEAQAVSMYIGGLPPTIEMNVRMFKPRTLADAFSLSNLQEAVLNLNKQRYPPLLPTPKSTTNTYVNRNVHYPAKTSDPLL